MHAEIYTNIEDMFPVNTWFRKLYIVLCFAVWQILADYIVGKLFSHFDSDVITVMLMRIVSRLHFLPLLSAPPHTGNNSLPLPLFLRSPRGRFLWSRHQGAARRQSTTQIAAATSPQLVTSPPILPPSKMDTTATRMHWAGLTELTTSTEMHSVWASEQRCPWTWRTRSAWRCRGRRRRRRKRRRRRSAT